MPFQETLWLETWAYIMIIIVCFSILFTLLAYVAILFWKQRFNLLNNNSNNDANTSVKKCLNDDELLFAKPLAIGANKFYINFKRHPSTHQNHNSIKNTFLYHRSLQKFELIFHDFFCSTFSWKIVQIS